MPLVPRFDFANLLFSGSCNQRCPYCIGHRLDRQLNRPNLDEFPPRGLDRLIDLIQTYSVRQLAFTGTNTDPQLYRHESELLSLLREKMPWIQISLHTNGQLARQKMGVFNLYDRATVSFPSFDPATFRKMTGTSHMPDLEAILRTSRIPVKVSCVLTGDNAGEVETFLDRCRQIGVRRVVFRECYGQPVPWHPPALLRQTGLYRNNPVYDWAGMEVTYWRFEQTWATSLNLFSDGSIGAEYLLDRHTPSPQLRPSL